MPRKKTGSTEPTLQSLSERDRTILLCRAWLVGLEVAADEAVLSPDTYVSAVFGRRIRRPQRQRFRAYLTKLRTEAPTGGRPGRLPKASKANAVGRDSDGVQNHQDPDQEAPDATEASRGGP